MNVMKATLLKEIEELEAEGKEALKEDQWRMEYHVMPPVGWLNDPNGLCQYQGEYYAFFQYSPFHPEGGLKVWGEYISKDLVHWEYAGVPLVADSPYDCHGAYSGSAFTEDGMLELFYTGNIKYEGDYDYVNTGRESNTIYTASKDGRKFGEKECLMSLKDYPKGYTAHIRDPKVWKEKGRYYMVLGGRKANDQGAVILYASDDKKAWRFQEEITTREPFGYMWECPDLFEIEGEKILSVCPQGLRPEEFRFQNVYQSGYFLLEDGKECEQKEFQEWDMGFDFYAPQTFLDSRGRRILMAWAGLPDLEGHYHNPTVEMGWQHSLTFPRELSVQGKRVLQWPVQEIESIRRASVRIEAEQEIPIESCSFDWEIEGMQGEFSILVDAACRLTWKDGVASLAFEGDAGQGRGCRKARINQVRDIRILADHSILEIFLNKGECVFTTRFYPKERDCKVKYQGKAEKSNLWILKK